MNKTSVKVEEIKSRPDKSQKFSMIMCGIRTKEAAEAWGAKYGFLKVYWIRADEKVYGVKTIADEAKTLEKRSAMLLSEAGNGCLEFMFLFGLVMFILLVVLKDVPW